MPTVIDVPNTSSSSRSSGSVPFVAGASVHGNLNFTATSERWLYSKADTSVTSQFNLVIQKGCPVAGVLVVDHEHKAQSIQYLTDLGSERYQLSQVLTVAIEQSGGQFVATDVQHGWYGYGDSEDQAICRFASGLVEELEGLQERKNQLSDSMRAELEQLKQIVIPHS